MSVETTQHRTREATRSRRQTGEATLRLLVLFHPPRDSARCLKVRAEVVRIVHDDQGVERVRNLTSTGSDTHPLSCLAFSALVDRDGSTFGWSTAYEDCYAVDLRRAGQMVKELRRLDRGHDRMEREIGSPESFAVYLARAAGILGVKAFGFLVGPQAITYDQTTYEWTDAAGMVSRVGERIAEFQT